MAALSVTLAEVEAAAGRIASKIHHTPLMSCSYISNLIGKDINLKFKCENLQKVGAFKYRGACNAVSMMLEADPTKNLVVTHSSGNHGQAVSCAAKSFGIKANVVMPQGAPQAKLQ